MILVTGATGHVGRAVVGRLASSGHEVAALVRDVQAAEKRLPSGIALRIADYEDPSALERAFAGIDDLVLISSDGEASAVMRHHANAIEAVAAAKIRRVTFTSIVDVDPSSRFYFSPVYRDAERRLTASAVPSTILRCGLYSDFILQHWLKPIPASGEFMLPTAQGRAAPISRDDVAAAVAAVAARQEGSGKIYTLTGHRAWGFDEIAASYGEAVARPVHHRSCSVEEYLASVAGRLDDPWPHAFSSLSTSIAEGHYSQVSKDFTAITGRAPEGLQDFLLRASAGAD
jgi:NAD(P)H dehydrogenase (quinone)